MLPKTNRLVKTKDFEKVFKQGRSFFTKLMGVKILGGQAKNNRFGVIISAKVSKKAVERNRLKRQIREALRELNKKLLQGFDLAIIVSPNLLKSDFKAIKNELEKVFIRLRLLK